MRVVVDWEGAPANLFFPRDTTSAGCWTNSSAMLARERELGELKSRLVANGVARVPHATGGHPVVGRADRALRRQDQFASSTSIMAELAVGAQQRLQVLLDDCCGSGRRRDEDKARERLARSCARRRAARPARLNLLRRKPDSHDHHPDC